MWVYAVCSGLSVQCLGKYGRNAYQSVLTFHLGAQKNRLIETVLLSTHNICFN